MIVTHGYTTVQSWIVEFDLSVSFATRANNVCSSDDWWRIINNLEASSASVMSRRWSLSSFDTCISRSEQNLLEKTHTLWQILILNRTQVSTCLSVYHINDTMVHKYCSTTSKPFNLRSCMISTRCFLLTSPLECEKSNWTYRAIQNVSNYLKTPTLMGLLFMTWPRSRSFVPNMKPMIIMFSWKRSIGWSKMDTSKSEGSKVCYISGFLVERTWIWSCFLGDGDCFYRGDRGMVSCKYTSIWSTFPWLSSYRVCVSGPTFGESWPRNGCDDYTVNSGGHTSAPGGDWCAGARLCGLLWSNCSISSKHNCPWWKENRIDVGWFIELLQGYSR